MKFTLEEWSEEYIPSVAKYADNEKIAGRLRDSFPYPYTRKDAEWFVKDCMEKEGKTQFSRAIVIDGEAVGCISLLFGDDVYSRSAELGYWLGEPFWRKGDHDGGGAEDVSRRRSAATSSSASARSPFPPTWPPAACWRRPGFTLEGIKRKSIFKNGCIQDSYLYAVIHVIVKILRKREKT